MAFLNFPASPANGAIYQVAGGSDTDVYQYYDPPGAWFKLSVPHASYQASGFTTLWRSRFDLPSAQTELAIQWSGLTGYSASLELGPNKSSVPLQSALVGVGGGVTVRLGVDSAAGINGAIFRHGTTNYAVWHVGNDGPSSGLNADMVDNYHADENASGSTVVARNGSGYGFFTYLNQSSGNNENPVVSQVMVTNGGDNYFRKSSILSFTSYVVANMSGYRVSWTAGQLSAMATTTASLGGVECLAPGNPTFASGAAMMAFHRTNVFAAYFGIDTDNQWKVGGWSMGANAYVVHHDGNRGVPTTFTPTLIPGSGAFGSTSCTGKVTQVGAKAFHISVDCQITNMGTAGGLLYLDIAACGFQPATGGAVLQCLNGVESGVSGWVCCARGPNGGTHRFLIMKYDNVTPMALNYRFVLNGMLYTD